MVLPTFAPLPAGDGIVRVCLAKAGRVLGRRAAEGGARAAVAGAVLDNIVSRNLVAGLEYFGRVWTLAERLARCVRGRSGAARVCVGGGSAGVYRMAAEGCACSWLRERELGWCRTSHAYGMPTQRRYGRRERLCNWLPLETWLGMVSGRRVALQRWVGAGGVTRHHAGTHRVHTVRNAGTSKPTHRSPNVASQPTPRNPSNHRNYRITAKVVDAMLKSNDDASAWQIYKKMLGEEASRKLDSILGPLVSQLAC